MRGQGSADGAAVAEDQVRHALREPELLEHLHHEDGGVRGELGGFDHEGVPGREGGGDLPRGLQQREVPGRDHAAHADRLADHAGDHRGVARIDQTARILVGDLPEVAEARGDVVHVALGLDQALAGVLRLGAGELVLALGEPVGDAQQEVPALPGRDVGPLAALEGGAGGEDRALDVLGPRLGDDADLGAVGGAEDGAGLAGGGRHPGAVDEQGRGALSHGSPRSGPARARRRGGRRSSRGRRDRRRPRCPGR